MITLYDFQLMSISEKAEAVWQGTCIAERFDGKTTIQLYHLKSFYAEVFYDTENNVITDVSGFKNTNSVEPYLQRITFKI